MEIKLYGTSDDILEIIENGNHREVYVEQSTVTLTCSSKTGSIWVTAIYDGSWAFAIGSMTRNLIIIKCLQIST